MLVPYGERYRKELAASEQLVFFLEDKMAQSPVLNAGFLLMNTGAENLSVRVRAVLDLGSSVLDPLDNGVKTQDVLPTATVTAGTNKRVKLDDLSSAWAMTYQGAVPSGSWKLRHEVTLINLSALAVTSFQLLITGFIDQPVDSTKLPNYALLRA